MPIVNVNTFPYTENDNVAPRTDGLLDSDPNGRLFMPPLGGQTTSQESRKQSGCVVQDYVGDTSMVFADRVWHPVLAGDF
jgi:hypothetical protein